MAKHYASDEDEFEEEDDETTSQDSDEAPELIASREDFESIMNEFMGKYEVVGRKIKPILEGDSGADKLNTLRRAMGHDDDRILVENDGGIDVAAGEEDVWAQYDDDPKKDRWDCETILSKPPGCYFGLIFSLLNNLISNLHESRKPSSPDPCP
jgi:protein LTV1